LRAERSLIQTIGRAARHVRARFYMPTTSPIAWQSNRGNRAASGNSVGIQRADYRPILKILTQIPEVRRLNAQQLETVYEQVDDMPLEQIRLITQLEADEGSSEELGV